MPLAVTLLMETWHRSRSLPLGEPLTICELVSAMRLIKVASDVAADVALPSRACSLAGDQRPPNSRRCSGSAACSRTLVDEPAPPCHST